MATLSGPPRLKTYTTSWGITGARARVSQRRLGCPAFLAGRGDAGPSSRPAARPKAPGAGRPLQGRRSPMLYRRQLTRASPGFMMRAGFPATVAPAGTSLVTTAPAPISASSPTVTPGMMSAPPPIHTFLPILMGRPNSKPWARSAGSRGWSAVRICTSGLC